MYLVKWRDGGSGYKKRRAGESNRQRTKIRWITGLGVVLEGENAREVYNEREKKVELKNEDNKDTNNKEVHPSSRSPTQRHD